MKKKFLLALCVLAIATLLFALTANAAEPVITWDISATENDSVFAYAYNDNGVTTIVISGTGAMKDFASADSTPWSTSIECVVIEEGVTNIGDAAFSECEHLTSISIADSVTSIGGFAFYYCSRLESIEIPEGVTYIGTRAFESCSSLSSVNIPSSMTSISKATFYGCESIRSITIPNSVTSIGDHAFSWCYRLKSIVIPDSVTSIGVCAFEYCYNMASVYIPSSVTSIKEYAFVYCEKPKIYCEAPSKPTTWSSYWNYYSAPVAWAHSHEYDSTTDLCVCGKANVYVEKWDISATDNDSVTAYLYNDPNNSGMYTLTISGTGEMKDWTSSSYVPWYSSYRSKITSVTIGKDVTRIGDKAFYGCDCLTSIVIPESVTSIGYCAFYYCSSLTSIVIPEGVTYIGNEAFYNCSGLTSIVIPEGVTSIGDYAFYGCSGLTSIVIPEGVTSIGNYTFYNCESLTSIVIPEGVMSIGNYAFYFCEITSIVIPDSVTSIGNYAFYCCSSLTSIVIPEGVTSICDGAFGGCSRLTSIVIPESVTYIGDRAFAYCYNLTSIVIPEGVTSIGDYAFYDCSSLTSVVIPEGVTSIGDSAFGFCSNLTSIVIPEGVTSIGNGAFSYCSNLTIYCEATSQPSGWDSDWNSSSHPVVWGYFDENACLSDIFTFKGYSFSIFGSMAIGFTYNDEAVAEYEAKTGKTLEIGVVFALFDTLNGKTPLDENGEAREVDGGVVIKGDLSGTDSKHFDFVLTDIDESSRDVKLVISAYIYTGDAVYYVQGNGLSNTVYGISFNEASNG